MSVDSFHLQVKHVHFTASKKETGEEKHQDSTEEKVSLLEYQTVKGLTISHRGQFEDGVQGTLQVGQIICASKNKKHETLCVVVIISRVFLSCLGYMDICKAHAVL